MTRWLAILLIATLPALADGRDIWRTDSGKRAIELRRQLRDLKWYDELAENWTEVEAALREGCQHFTHGVSRVERRNGKRLWRVLPIVAPRDSDGRFTPWSHRP